MRRLAWLGLCGTTDRRMAAVMTAKDRFFSTHGRTATLLALAALPPFCSQNTTGGRTTVGADADAAAQGTPDVGTAGKASTGSSATTVAPCTAAACPCEDGGSQPSADGCNTCTCTAGKWSCSADPCEVCPPLAPVERPCESVTVFARDPNSDLCCQYGAPCVAPAGWQVFYSEAECLSGVSTRTTWYAGCADPSCASTGATGAPACAPGDEVSAPCDTLGAECDPGLGCGLNLICASADPKLSDGGCAEP